jgi:Holliday junction resolvase-like predicted endonuclease
MKDQSEIVFVEVKGRDINSLHEGEDALTHSKRRRIISAAETYMKDIDTPARFGVIAVKYNAEEGKIKKLEGQFSSKKTALRIDCDSVFHYIGKIWYIIFMLIL